MIYLDKMIFRYNLLYTDQYKIFYILILYYFVTLNWDIEE